MVLPVALELADHQDLQVLLDHQEVQEHLVHQVAQELQDLLEALAHQVAPELLELREQQDPLEHPEPQVLLDHQVYHSFGWELGHNLQE